MSAVRSLRQVRSIPALRSSLHSSAATPKPSHLLSGNIQTRYAGLTVNSLKQECRQRGLRISGKKAELVDRLVVYETTKSFSTSQPAEAKGDDSHIDFWKIPTAPGPKIQGAAKPPFKIPVPPDASYTAPELDVDYSPKTAIPDAASAPRGVHVVGGNDGTVAAMNTDHGSVVNVDDGASAGDKIPSRDKPFLLGLAAAISAWWGSSLVGKKEKK